MSNFYDFFSLYIESPGDIIAMATNVVPPGFLECNGAAVSRTTYAELFTVIGTFFGTGDGSTTFNIPDLRGQFLRSTDDAASVDTKVASRTRPSDSTVVGDIVGTKQGGEVPGHTHTQLLSRTSTSWSNHSAQYNAQTGQPTSQTGDIRPSNIYVMFCIKI